MDRFRYLLFSVFPLFFISGAYAGNMDEDLMRLKVADAERCGWDTLPEFRHYCRAMEGKVWKELMVDAGGMDSLLHALYRESVERYSVKGWVKLEEISVRLSQHAAKREVAEACQRMDSIYACLRQGVSFDAFIKEHTVPVWRPVAGLLQEFSSRLERMEKGTYTTPFLSPLGVHIIRLADRKPAVSYEEAYPYLSIYAERLGRRNPALKQGLYAQWAAGHVEDGFLEKRLREVKDRLLVEWWDRRHPLPVPDERDLETYFEAHKGEYAWEFPHYKGAVIRCQNKKMASRIRKCLKKLPQAQWEEAFRIWKEANPEADAVIEVGLFQIGKNAYVDKLAFECGEFPHDVRYPYVCVMGKRLKKGPEDFRDVRKQVEKDYYRVQIMEQIGKSRQESLKLSGMTYKNR